MEYSIAVFLKGEEYAKVTVAHGEEAATQYIKTCLPKIKSLCVVQLDK